MRPTFAAFAATLFGGIACLTAGAQADDLPARKAGLWEITMHMSSGNTPAQTMKFCIDAATDAELYKFGMNAAQGMCSRYDLHRSGSTATVDTECKMGEMKMTSHSDMIFAGDAAYKTETKSHFDPPMMGRSDSTMTQEAKWTGPCPADMKPGVLVGPNGMKMNMKSLGK
jgi:Protein of unknown function (DUF3617)